MAVPPLALATDYARRMFALGDVAAVRFFGGAALRLDGVQFGMVMGSALYFRVDAESRDAFLAAGSVPFGCRGDASDARAASWLSAPPHILDDPDALSAWGAAAHRAARAAAAKKKRR